MIAPILLEDSPLPSKSWVSSKSASRLTPWTPLRALARGSSEPGARTSEVPSAALLFGARGFEVEYPMFHLLGPVFFSLGGGGIYNIYIMYICIYIYIGFFTWTCFSFFFFNLNPTGAVKGPSGISQQVQNGRPPWRGPK